MNGSAPSKGESRIDLEFGFVDLISATKGLSSLCATMQSGDVSGLHLAALLDMIVQKQQMLGRAVGFDIAA